MTTWGDIKRKLVNLGFEETDITSEYGSLMIDSTNRALDIIYNIVVPQIEGWYKLTESWGYEDENGKWVLPKPRPITSDTADTDIVNIADNLRPLVELVAAHYVWLDDDITKATMYWNEYDMLKGELIATCRQPKNAVITGGVRW